jgi:uncharacterized protein (DUF362 family)
MLRVRLIGLGCLALVACRNDSNSSPGLTSAKPRPATSAAAPTAAAASASAAHASKHEPDTLSHASEAYDAGPPVIASGAVDGAELRKRHAARLKNERSKVTVLRGDGPLELGRRICEAVVPKRPPDTPILIKPNICGFDGIKDKAKTGDDGVTGRITDPEFVRGVLQCLKARGQKRVTLAEGCGISHAHFKKTVAISGYEAMAAAEGVPLVAMDDDGVYDVEGAQPGKPLSVTGLEKTSVPTLLLPKILAETLDHGLFISVPKLKAHRYSVVSLAIKGMQGTVMRSDAAPAYKQKWRMHEELKPYLRAKKNREPEDRAQYVASLELFAERMVDVLELSTPDVILVDGAPAVAGDGFQTLRQVPEMIAIGGTHPVLVDRVGAEYLGLWNNSELARELGGHRTSPLITLAARRYGVDLQEVELVGDGVETLKRPRAAFFKAIAPFTLEGERVISTAPPPAPAASGSDAPAFGATPTTGGRPEARAPRATTAPVIDGKRDTAWDRAPAIPFDTDYTGAHTGVRTTARLLWNEQALFALFELENAGLNVDRSFDVARERTKLYEEDCVELFLTPDPKNRERYYEIELGPFGHFFDLEVDRAKKSSNTAWSSGLEVRTTQDTSRRTAVIEARFSSPDIVRALTAGARLPFALYRMEGRSPRQYLAFSPPRTKKPNFHVPEAFATLVLDPN